MCTYCIDIKVEGPFSLNILLSIFHFWQNFFYNMLINYDTKDKDNKELVVI